jgi:hypothetical protein
MDGGMVCPAQPRAEHLRVAVNRLGLGDLLTERPRASTPTRQDGDSATTKSGFPVCLNPTLRLLERTWMRAAFGGHLFIQFPSSAPHNR